MSDYVTASLAGFERDPADTDYQKGFREALILVRDEGIYPELCHALAQAERALRAAQARIEVFEAREDTHFIEAGDADAAAARASAALERVVRQ